MKRYPVPLIMAFVLLFSPGCKKEEVQKAPAEKVINVRVQSAEKKTVRPFVEAIGTLNPFEEVLVSAEIDGLVNSVAVDEGSAVAKGALLTTIDDTDYALDVKRAEAALRQAEATLANTSQEFERKKTLFREELVTRQQYDDVSTRLSLSEADVEKAKASLSLARQKLSKAKIHSPLAGVVREKKIERGNYVRNGSLLFTLIQSNPLKLDFTVPEKEVGRLRIGQDITLAVDAFPGREFRGRVSIIYPSLDEKTRTLQIRALVPNSDGLLKPGMFAKVMLYTASSSDTIVVPVTALLYEGEQVRVFVVDGDRARERQVRLGGKYGEVMAVLEGIREGEKVVVVGQQNLAENVKVAVQPASKN